MLMTWDRSLNKQHTPWWSSKAERPLCISQALSSPGEEDPVLVEEGVSVTGKVCVWIGFTSQHHHHRGPGHPVSWATLYRARCYAAARGFPLRAHHASRTVKVTSDIPSVSWRTKFCSCRFLLKNHDRDKHLQCCIIWLFPQ